MPLYHQLLLSLPLIPCFSTTNICISIYLNALLSLCVCAVCRREGVRKVLLFFFLYFFGFWFLFLFLFFGQKFYYNLFCTHICYLSPAKWIEGFISIGILWICVRRCAWPMSKDLKMSADTCSVSYEFRHFLFMLIASIRTDENDISFNAKQNVKLEYYFNEKYNNCLRELPSASLSLCRTPLKHQHDKFKTRTRL